ncbi:DUF992 domain-containing protein [Roseomonas sp. WA12]
MNRASLAAAAALLALAGPALAQTGGQPPVVYVPPAPGTAAPAPNTTVVVPNAVVQGTVVPGSTTVVPGTVMPGTVVTPQPVVPGQAVQGTVVPGTLVQPGQPVPPGSVQTGTVMVQPAPRGNTRVGQLQCDVSGGVGFIFGSSRDLTCEFKPSNGPVERYHGEIRRFGVDIGVTGRGTMLWTVVNTGSDVAPGSLAGTYAGASSNVSAGLGLGSAVLIGGSNDQVALQPLSIESNTGVNVAAGIAELNLRQGG